MHAGAISSILGGYREHVASETYKTGKFIYSDTSDVMVLWRFGCGNAW